MHYRCCKHNIRCGDLHVVCTAPCTVICRGFMDDLTITMATHVQTRWILKALDNVATWARMKFKPKKSRSMVIRNGKVTNRFQLQVQGEVIPPIEENPIKCLGKWYDSSLKDKGSVS